MEFHPAASIFPMMTEEEYVELRADIRDNGQREAIWVYEGKILDGRNRERACEELGIPVKSAIWDGNGSPTAFVISLNLHRRHLTATQRAAIGVAGLPLFEAEAKAAQDQGRKEGGRIAGKGRPALHQNKDKAIRHESTAVGRAGKAVGTSGSMVAAAKKVIDKAPELQPAMLSGILTLSEAEKVMPFEPDERAEIVERIQSGEAPDVKTAVRHMAEDGRAPAAIHPSFEAKHAPGAKWNRAWNRINEVFRGISERGGFEGYIANWSAERRLKSAKDIQRTIERLQGFIRVLEGDRNAKSDTAA